MAFLQPLLLALGLAVAVPLILHLFHRHHGPRVVFPALRYLRRAERESARRVKLRQIVLLLLRMAAVLLIALAAARPFLARGGMNHEPTAVVIILDNSMSSGAVVDDARVLDELKARALETLAMAEPEDRFWLLRAGSPLEPAIPADALETARRVRETEPGAAAADLPASIARAHAILAAGAEGRAREIQLLSDLQATNFHSILGARGIAVDVVAWRPGTPPPNRAITDLRVGGGMAPGAGERSSVTVTMGGTGDDTVNVRLLIADRLAAAGRGVPGGIVVLDLPPRSAGLLTGLVEMDADALRADNRRYFATTVTPPPLVALAAPLPFVEEALGALESAGRIRRTSRGAAAGGGAVVLVPGGAATGVIGRNATTVILPPESPLQIEGLNRRLATSRIPWTYVVTQGAGEARFALEDSTDAVLRTLENARLRNVYALRPTTRAAGDTTLLRLRDGGPWAVRGQHADGGRYILIASPLTEGASTIPTSAAMLPLLDRIIRGWAAESAVFEEAQPGDLLALPAGATAIERPDSVAEPVTGGRYQVPAVAGVYRIMSDERAISAFAVNPPARESDLRVVTEAGLRERLPDWSVETARDAGEWQREVFRQRVGRELWRPLLLALLVVLAMEAIIAAAGVVGRARRTETV